MDVIRFKQLFLPCHKKLYKIAFRIMQNESDAEDMVQETYLKLWNKREELENINNQESFSITVLKNICFDNLRNSKKHFITDIDEEMTLENKNSLIQEIEYKDESDLIKKIILSLPDQQQMIMKLYHLKDFNLKEIEKITGLSSSNIRSILSRGRKKVREQIEVLFQ